MTPMQSLRGFRNIEEENSTIKPNIQDTVSRGSQFNIKYSKCINRKSLRQTGQQGNIPNMNKSMIAVSGYKTNNVI